MKGGDKHMSYRKDQYKDLEKWQTTKRKGQQQYYSTTQGYPRKSWTAHEDELVLKHDKSDRILSQELKRSMQSIQSRRSRLKSGTTTL